MGVLVKRAIALGITCVMLVSTSLGGNTKTNMSRDEDELGAEYAQLKEAVLKAADDVHNANTTLSEYCEGNEALKDVKDCLYGYADSIVDSTGYIQNLDYLDKMCVERESALSDITDHIELKLNYADMRMEQANKTVLLPQIPRYLGATRINAAAKELANSDSSYRGVEGELESYDGELDALCGTLNWAINDIEKVRGRVPEETVAEPVIKDVKQDILDLYDELQDKISSGQDYTESAKELACKMAIWYWFEDLHGLSKYEYIISESHGQCYSAIYYRLKKDENGHHYFREDGIPAYDEFIDDSILQLTIKVGKNMNGVEMTCFGGFDLTYEVDADGNLAIYEVIINRRSQFELMYPPVYQEDNVGLSELELNRMGFFYDPTLGYYGDVLEISKLDEGTDTTQAIPKIRKEFDEYNAAIEGRENLMASFDTAVASLETAVAKALVLKDLVDSKGQAELDRYDATCERLDALKQDAGIE